MSGLGLAAVEYEALVRTDQAQRSDERLAFRRHSGQDAEALIQRSEKLFALRIGVSDLFHIDWNIEDMVWIEAERDVFRFLGAANE